MAETIKIGGELESTATGNVVAAASAIKDKVKNKYQSEINNDVARHENEIHGTGGIDSRLSDVEQMEQIVIDGGEAQIATGTDFTNPDATKRAKIPTVGAIVDGLNDGVYDVSKRNPTAGPNSDGKFTLDYILSNADTLIPTGWRHGGMIISFVDSSDNKYIRYNLLAQSFTTDTTQWAIADGLKSTIHAGQTVNRPTDNLSQEDAGFVFFDLTLNKPIWWDGTVWVDENGTDVTYVTRTRGTTLQRTTMSDNWSEEAKAASDGLKFYDTFLHKYVLWNGSDWVNLDGSALN